MLAAGCGLPTDEKETGAADAPGPPNVILILTDDQDAKSIKYMPNVKSLLAEQGTTFENAFVTDPLCCPARATFLRGQYSHNHQIVGNKPPYGGFEKFRSLGHEESTMATWLQDEGYGTVFIGKYMNGYAGRHVPPGWDEWHAISGNYLSHDLNENGRIIAYDPQRYHLDDVLAEKATEYLRRTSGVHSPWLGSDRPFFMWLGPKAPHYPASPAPRHEDDFADISLPHPPSFDERDVSDKPEWVRNNLNLSQEGIAYLEQLHRKRLQSLQAVDEMVKDLVDALRESGELENTYIFFTSDNGYHLGEHRMGAGKWTAYEEDIKVPLIVRGPGVPEGKTLEHLVLNNDLAPTFTELAGGASPPFVDGRSLMSLLTDDPQPKENWRQAFLVEAAEEPALSFVDERWPEPRLTALLTGDPLPEDWRRAFRQGAGAREDWGRPGLEAIRTEDHLYVEYDTGERELYDLKEDPYQLNNEYAAAEPDLIRQLGGWLGALRECAGADCHTVEDGY